MSHIYNIQLGAIFPGMMDKRNCYISGLFGWILKNWSKKKNTKVYSIMSKDNKMV